MDDCTDDVLTCQVIVDGLDRAEAEALLLEIRRLARSHGVDVVATAIEVSETSTAGG